MRGQQTPPKKVEQVKAIAAKEGNILEASRQVGIPNQTAYDIIHNEDNFGKYRDEEMRKYVVSTWANIQAISDALTDKVKQNNISELQLRDLTGALKDLRKTVENVVNNIHIGDNIINLDPHVIEQEAITLLEGLGYLITKVEK